MDMATLRCHQGARRWAAFTDTVYPSLVRALTGALIVVPRSWMGAGIVQMLIGLRNIFTLS